MNDEAMFETHLKPLEVMVAADMFAPQPPRTLQLETLLYVVDSVGRDGDSSGEEGATNSYSGSEFQDAEQAATPKLRVTPRAALTSVFESGYNEARQEPDSCWFAQSPPVAVTLPD